MRAQVHCLRIFKDSVVLVPPYIPGRRHPPRVMWNHYIKVKKTVPRRRVSAPRRPSAPPFELETRRAASQPAASRASMAARPSAVQQALLPPANATEQPASASATVRLQRRNPCDPAERRMRSQAVSVAESEQFSTLAFFLCTQGKSSELHSNTKARSAAVQ